MDEFEVELANIIKGYDKYYECFNELFPNFREEMPDYTIEYLKGLYDNISRRMENETDPEKKEFLKGRFQRGVENTIEDIRVFRQESEMNKIGRK